MNFAEPKKVLCQGHNKIFEGKEAKDVNGIELNLYEGTYEMMGCSFSVLIKKGQYLKIESYDVLRTFRHDNSIEFLDFYTDAENKGCLILPVVDTTFKAWVEDGGKQLLFNRSGHMSALLKSLIIGYSSLVDSLTKKGLLIEIVGMGDIFISLSSLKLRILLTRVKEVKVLSGADKKKNWNHIRTFATWCARKCNVKMDTLTDTFCNYIGENHFKVERLNAYPDDWDHANKGEYLLALAACHPDDMRPLLHAAEIHWPYETDHWVEDNLPSLLRKIIDWEENINGRVYNTLDPATYIRLLRNLYKHYKTLPEEIKAILGDRKSIIDVVELWSPGIWIKIYERAGWP